MGVPGVTTKKINTPQSRDVTNHSAPPAEAPTSAVHQTLDNHRTTYRARPIPNHYDIKSLAAAIVDALELSHVFEIKIHSLAADTSDPTETPHHTATLSFLYTPNFPTQEGDSRQWQILLLNHDRTGEDEIYIDSHFRGFTPLSPLKDDDKRDIDCIAIHGWGGHAFGSFRAGNEYMWLRDRLAQDEPRFRVWTYGYDSKLTTKESIANFYEYAEDFRHLLRVMRGKENGPSGGIRPIILIVHSLGGIIFKKAYIDMEKSEYLADKWNFKSTYGALFFGVPKNGMEVEALMTMIGDNPQRYNLSLLDRFSGHRLRFNEHQEFCKVFDFKDSKIIQFYELHKTQSVKLDKDQTSFTRTGALKLFVDPDSATSGREWENTNDYKIGIHADHSGIVKFGPNKDVNYLKVKGVLQNFSKAALPTIERRFSLNSSIDNWASLENSTGPASSSTSIDSLGKSNNYQHHPLVDAQRARSDSLPVSTPIKKKCTFLKPRSLPSDFIEAAKDGENSKLLEWLRDSTKGTQIGEKTINEALIAVSGKPKQKGDQATVIRSLLRAEADLQYKDDKAYRTPLIWAITAKREDLVDVILEQEAVDSFIEISDGVRDWTPLLWAVSFVISSRSSSSSEGILGRLIGKNANLAATDRKMKWTPLHWAASKGADTIIKILLKDGLNSLEISKVINLEDKDKQTPLTLACRGNHKTTVKLLIENGANRNIEIEPRMPLLIDAVRARNEPVVRMLLEGKGLSHPIDSQDPTESINSTGSTGSAGSTGSDDSTVPLEGKEKQERTEMLEARDGKDHTALWWAIKDRNKDLQNLLITHGANTSIADELRRPKNF